MPYDLSSFTLVLLIDRSMEHGPIGLQQRYYVISTLVAIGMWVDGVAGATDRDGFGGTGPPMSPVGPLPGTRFAG